MRIKFTECTFFLLLVTALVKTAVPCTWDYSQLDEWGTICEGVYAVCTNGLTQSPIDVATYSVNLKLGPLNHTLRELTDISITNNGHAIQIQPWIPGASLGELTSNALDGVYKLAQFHFHTPSEHRINGEGFAAELHFVHTKYVGNIINRAVVGVLFKLDNKSNPALDMIISALPSISVPNTTVNFAFDPALLLPAIGHRNFFNYKGSLTSPPCIEGLDWFLYDTPLGIGLSQLNAIRSIYNFSTARPVQNIFTRSPVNYYHDPPSTSCNKVTVQNGFTSAEFSQCVPQGSLVHIWASIPNGMLFDSWRGKEQDIIHLESTSNSHTTFIMPARSVILEANFKSQNSFGFTLLEVGTAKAYYLVPKHSRGVIFWFHGDGERSIDYLPSTPFIDIEKFYFFQNLLSAGYGIVAIDSCCSLPGTDTYVWQTEQSANNTDIKNVQMIAASLIDKHLFYDTDTIFVAGALSGAQFALLFGDLYSEDQTVTVPQPLNVVAAVLFGDVGTPYQADSTTIPRMFVVMANQRNNAPQAIFRASNILKERNVVVDRLVIQPTPLHPNIFTIVPHTTTLASNFIVNSLVAQGYLDPVNYYFIKDPIINSNWTDILPSTKSRDQLKSLVRVAYAAEYLSGGSSTGHVIEFLNRYSTVDDKQGWVIGAIMIGLMIAFLIGATGWYIVRSRKRVYERV